MVAYAPATGETRVQFPAGVLLLRRFDDKRSDSRELPSVYVTFLQLFFLCASLPCMKVRTSIFCSNGEETGSSDPFCFGLTRRFSDLS